MKLYCNGLSAIRSNDFGRDTFTASLFLFHRKLRPMSHYLNNSCYRALWKCPDCGGEYIRSIRDMATGNVDCVYCSMKEVLPGVNSFAVLHPDLMNEWNHLDNYLLCDPDQILDNCITPVCWTCPVCAHDYKCSPKQRILYQKRNMDACTFCKGLRRKERHYI